MALAREAEIDAVVHQSLAAHPGVDAGLAQQIDRALLEHAGTNPALDIVARAPLEDHGLDAALVQELREQQPRWTRPHDADLGAHGARASSITIVAG